MKALRAATILWLLGSQAKAAELPLDRLKLPPGFRIEVFAPNVDNARSLALGAKGTVFVGSHDGNVYALTDADHDGHAEKVRILAQGLNMPNGVAFRDGALYVAEIQRLLRFDHIEDHLDKPGEPAVVYDKFPTDKHHGWKFIAFGPDGLLYVPVGMPCNVCEKPDPYGTISRMKLDGSAPEVFARGIRNTVGFAWHPQTKELWFTDNGRDLMGDDIPPDELNAAPKPGMNFGFPYCHGGTVKDPQFGSKKACKEFTPPALNFGAHVASLGMRFYTGKMFPPKYQGRAFVALHGSWNRSSPSGYRVMSLVTKGHKGTKLEPFIEGWLGSSGKAWGRPVDVMELPDGSLLVSDDEGDAVYRVTYENPSVQSVRPVRKAPSPR